MNIALSFNIQAAQGHTKPIDTSKLTTGHLIVLHREEKQEEGDRGDQEEKRGNLKERDRSSQ